MAIKLPVRAREILERADALRQPLAEFDLVDQLSELAKQDDLSLEERKGALAESAAFFFRPIPDENSRPWDAYFGPTITATDAKGQPVYLPDLAEVDADFVAHWESRASEAKHPVIRARYADLVWDLKTVVLRQRPDIQFARIATDSYLAAVEGGLYRFPVEAVDAFRRALHIAVSTADTERVNACKKVLIACLDSLTESIQVANWAAAGDGLLRRKGVFLTAEETGRIIAALERLLSMCTAQGGGQFEPWSAEAAARVLAAHYDRNGKREEVHRVIRAYGTAFESMAAEASPTFAMGWLQPVYEEYRNRGMVADAERVLKSYAEKGKGAAADLKEIHAPIEIPKEDFDRFLDEMSDGTLGECLARIAARFVPKVRVIKSLLQWMLDQTPLLARIEVTRIVGDHVAAAAGSIETDPDGRLIMQLAQYVDGENLFLVPALSKIREKHSPDAATILAHLEESPIFDPERRSLLCDGLDAYLRADHVKAIHVLVPQVEHILRRLLGLLGIPILRAGKRGTMQVKNLNEILREPAICTALGEDLQLYLLELLADQRGHNIRNVICHGFAAPVHLNQQVADRVLHVLLCLALVREKTVPSV